MKKCFLGVVLVFLLSGCTAEYNLTINDINEMTYDESFQIKSSNLNEISAAYNNATPMNAYDDEDFFSESNEKIPGVSYYEVNSYKKNNIYYVDYHFKFPSNRFDHAAGLKTGFYNFSKTYNEDDDTITLDSGEFSYEKFPELEKLIVNVKVQNEVTSHNATRVQNGVYQWEITDFENARLVLTYKNKSQEEEKSNQKEAIITVIVCMIFFIIFVVMIKKNQSKKYH